MQTRLHRSLFVMAGLDPAIQTVREAVLMDSSHALPRTLVVMARNCGPSRWCCTDQDGGVQALSGAAVPRKLDGPLLLAMTSEPLAVTGRPR